MNDIEYQASFVAAAVERILSLIDTDPLSDTFGCAHLAFWRDKTSDLADMRRQEVLFPLALLYSREFPQSTYRGSIQLKAAINALITFWCHNQYPDGSMDEWYKGERGFAAAAFSTHAVARTLFLMQDALPTETASLAFQKLHNTASMLTGRDDLFKTNHQAVAVAALAWAGYVLNDPDLTRNAESKLESVLSTQQPEGWFPEIGHMDIGYTFLTVEYVTMAMHLWDNWSKIDPLRKAFDFACEWLHPDLTTGDEYGICHNPYVSRIATVLLSPFSERAAWMFNRLEKNSIGALGMAPTMYDDLRLCRWAFQPLLALLHTREMQPSTITPKPVPLADPESSTYCVPSCSLLRFSACGGTGVFSAVSGGLLRLFDVETGRSFSDSGYAIRVDEQNITNQTYDPSTAVSCTSEGWKMTCPLIPVKKFMPPFWARIVLRFLSSTAVGSRLTRKAIDVIRKRKKTAINQSSANICKVSSSTLCRLVSVANDSVIVTDVISFKLQRRSSDISFVESRDNEIYSLIPITTRLTQLPATIGHLEVKKIYERSEIWELRKISAAVS